MSVEDYEEQARLIATSPRYLAATPADRIMSIVWDGELVWLNYEGALAVINRNKAYNMWVTLVKYSHVYPDVPYPYEDAV